MSSKTRFHVAKFSCHGTSWGRCSRRVQSDRHAQARAAGDGPGKVAWREHVGHLLDSSRSNPDFGRVVRRPQCRLWRPISIPFTLALGGGIGQGRVVMAASGCELDRAGQQSAQLLPEAPGVDGCHHVVGRDREVGAPPQPSGELRATYQCAFDQQATNANLVLWWPFDERYCLGNLCAVARAH